MNTSRHATKGKRGNFIAGWECLLILVTYQQGLENSDSPLFQMVEKLYALFVMFLVHLRNRYTLLTVFDHPIMIDE